MITRFRLTAFVFVVCLAVLVLTELQRVPVSQMELYAGNEVGTVVEAFAAAGALASALDALPVERRSAFVDAGTPSPSALKSVEVTPVSPKRVRIRVASSDRAASGALAEQLRRELVAAGMVERLTVSFTSTSGPARLMVLLATALAGLTLLAEAAVRWRGGRATSSPVAAMPGAASI